MVLVDLSSFSNADPLHTHTHTHTREHAPAITLLIFPSVGHDPLTPDALPPKEDATKPNRCHVVPKVDTSERLLYSETRRVRGEAPVSGLFLAAGRLIMPFPAPCIHYDTFMAPPMMGGGIGCEACL